MKKLFANVSIILLIIILTNWVNPSIHSIAASSLINDIETDDSHITINKVDLRVKVDGKFVRLEDLVLEGQTAEEASTFPRIENGSTIQINATYSTIIGGSDSFVIREFTIIIYDVVNESVSKQVGASRYRSSKPEDLILKPNSSKSEIITINSIQLPDFTAYKFVFRLQYHIYLGDQTPIDTYYRENMTFELIERYPQPPYFLIYVFYFVGTIFIAIVLLGIYGDRKYRTPS